MKAIKLAALQPGDTVGLVAPAGPVSREQIQDGLAVLEASGLRYQIGRRAFANQGLTAASAAERIEDLEAFLKDETMKAIWAIRGGYGTIQLLDALRFTDFRQYPKIFIGFSDVTALQWAVYQQVRLPSISGFTLVSQFSAQNTFLSLGMRILNGTQHQIASGDLAGEAVAVYQEGEARGTLIGGTLAMICTLCGTPYFLKQKALIVYLEDINEPLYRIDRCLRQLALNGFWKQVKGVILGKFIYDQRCLTILPLIAPLLAPDIPIIYNFPYGHMVNSLPMPVGVQVSLTTSPLILKWEPFIQ